MVALKLTRDVQPVFRAEVEIQCHQIKGFRRKGRPHALRVMRLGHKVAIAFKAAPQKRSDLGIVINNKDFFRGHGHHPQKLRLYSPQPKRAPPATPSPATKRYKRIQHRRSCCDMRLRM